MSNLKLGFVGAGFVANFHRRAIKGVRGVDLAGVYALKGAEELATAARNDGLGDTKVYNNVADLCNNVDVVGIFCPNFARVDTMGQITEAVLNGAELKGVVCEKPLARTINEAATMVSLAKLAGMPTAYYENQIHMPSIVAARAQLSKLSETVGPIHLTRSAEEHGGPHEGWFWDPTRQGGGVWCDMGCHSAAVGRHMLTPPGEKPDFLELVSVNASMALLKWGREPFLSLLKKQRGVDYEKTPAEDYATVVIKFRNPKTGQILIAQATDSWMYDAPGLRLSMEALGPGWSYSVNTLVSPTELFISDAAANAVANAELALEKSQSSRGKLILLEDEPGLYGYSAEWLDAVAAFKDGKDALLNFEYGLSVARLVAVGYKSAEEGKTVKVSDVPDDFVPLIHQGKGKEVLC